MEVRPLPETLDGGRIVLRKHSPAHADEMFRYVDRDRERLRRWLAWVDDMKTVGDERGWIEKALAQWDAGELYSFGIFRKPDGLYLGNIGVHAIAWEHARCEIGYWILGDFEGAGFMSEAVQRLERALFALGFHRIEIRCDARNERSANVPRRNGYALDGTLRQDSLVEDGFRDTLVFSKLQSDQ